MKVLDLKELTNQGKGFEELGIEIKKYLNFVEKKILCDKVLNGAISLNKNGIMSVNRYNLRFFTDLVLIENYTNIEIDNENVVSDYDFLCEQDIIKKIKELIPEDELYFIHNAIYEGIDDKLEESNSIGAVLANKLNKLIEIIDKNTNPKEIKSFIKVLSREFKDFDINKLEQIKSLVNKLK